VDAFWLEARGRIRTFLVTIQPVQIKAAQRHTLQDGFMVTVPVPLERYDLLLG
jgi:hypothetical protein